MAVNMAIVHKYQSYNILVMLNFYNILTNGHFYYLKILTVGQF